MVVYQGVVNCGTTITGDTSGAPSQCGNLSPEYAFSFIVGSTNELTFDSCSSDYDTYLRVYNSSGDLVASNDDGSCGSGASLIVVTLEPGTYTLLVEGFSSESGEYTVAINGVC